MSANSGIASARLEGVTHVVIPDTQHGPERRDNHLWWAGQYLHDHLGGKRAKRTRIIMLGDHATMDSLNGYDTRGGTKYEGRRYTKDIDASNDGWDALNTPIEKDHFLSKHVTLGNHEQRIIRAYESDARLEGALSVDHLNYAAWGWSVHDFLVPVELEGVTYSHYFANPNTGKPLGGQSMDTRLKSVGYTFTMGHQQGLKVGMRELTNGTRHRALVAGSYYLHDEDYAGPQGNNVWRGILVCHTVQNGNYALMEVDADYLCRRYEGMSLKAFWNRYGR